MSKVTPIRIGQLILEPIRHFFSVYSPNPDFFWDPDPKKTKIDISMVNDANKELIDYGVQILVDRGTLSVNKSGLSDSLMHGKSMAETQGLYDRTQLLIYSGEAMITIKSRTEGNVEVLADMVMHILQWSRPHICDVLGFKDFALPMSISAPHTNKIDVEVFEVEISVPYMLEEVWRSHNDALKLRDLFINIAGQ